MFLSLFICYFLLVDKTKVGMFFYIPNFFCNKLKVGVACSVAG